MKKNTLFVLSLLSLICLVFFACRKEIDRYINDKTGPGSRLIESAKIWRLQNLDIASKKSASAPTRILKPHWDDSWVLKLQSGQEILVVPSSEHFISNKMATVRRFFVFETKNEYVLSGRIVELVGLKYNVSGNLEILLTEYKLSTISGLSGAILQYDINYRPLSAASFKDGRKNNSVVSIINTTHGQLSALQRREGQGPANGKLMLSPNQKVTMTGSECPTVYPILLDMPSGLAQDCIVTLLHEVTYVDGCLVTETYRYLRHRCPGDSTSQPGSGSGSGSGTSTSDGNPDYGGAGGYSAKQIFINGILLTDLDPCVANVLYSLLYQSDGDVVGILNKFAGSIPGYNWTIGDGTLGANVMGETATHYDLANGIVTTTFDSGKYGNSSTLAVAKTILHESVHAYLVAYFGANAPLANLSYPEFLTDYYHLTKPDANASQHNEIVRDFKDDIAAGLKEYGNMHGISFATEAEKTQFYSDLAWGGLETTPAYLALPQADRNRIKDVINAEQFGTDRNGDPKSPKGPPAGC